MLLEVIKTKHVAAMKARNAVLKSAYGNVLAKIAVAEKSGKYALPLEDAIIEGLIQKEIKELAETKAGFLATARVEEAVRLQMQIDELEQHLPKMFTELEVESMIVGYAATSGETNKGKITGAIAKMVGNRFDKSKIKDIVDRIVN